MTPNNPIIIGITGYPGTGKSTLAKIFKLMKYPVQKSDQVVNELFQRPEVSKKIIQVFPQAAYKATINKVRLADIVFKETQQLKQLEQILHPLVYEEHHKFIRLNENQKLIIFEIPLLFETGGESVCDVIFYTTCQTHIARKRIEKRGWSQERYHTTLKRLLPDTIKMRKAQYIIDTSLSKVNTWHQLKSALQEMCNIENSNA